jgi:hypothetical protein
LCFSALTTYTLQAEEIKHPEKHFKRNKDSWLGCASLHILTNYFFHLMWRYATKKSLVFKIIVLVSSLFLASCATVANSNSPINIYGVTTLPPQNGDWEVIAASGY